MNGSKYCIIFLFSALASTGCMVGPKYSQPSANTNIEYPNATKTDTSALAQWFQIYQDTVLQRLIKATIDSNRDLMAAASRIEEARALSGAVKADLYPKLGYQAQAGGGRAGTDATKIAGGYNSGVLNAFGTLTWELDVWGKLRHASRASINDFLSTEANRDALQVSLVAEVASDYFLMRNLDNQLDITQQTLRDRKENTRLISEKFEKGYSSELDKLQAQQQEAIAAASIPFFERELVFVQNALRVLTGIGPGVVSRGASNYDQVLSPDIPVGLPSQLLQRRPDVVASEYALKAQFERIGVAEANRFPTISLTGILGFASPQLSTLISNNGFVANGFGSIAGPIFNFGQLKNLTVVEKKKTEVLYYQYQQTALQAFSDVDNALASYRTYNEEHSQRVLEVEAAAKALKLSQALYDNGYVSYLEVIVQQTNLFQAQLDESAAMQQKLNSIVLLYKALGGGWTTQ